MAYRNKTYVAFDGDNDIRYYNLMKAWKQNDYTDFNFYDAHDLNTARDTSLETTIKAKLKERMNNSKVFVLLVGEHTKNLYRFVRWEIEQALSMNLPIIVVNLNGKRQIDADLCPPILKDKLAIHISFGAKIMQYALENWPNSYVTKSMQGDTANYRYPDTVYDGL